MQNVFPFADDANVASITCCHVMEGGAPIHHVSHDIEDGMWQFLCWQAHKTSDAVVVGLGEVYTLDTSIGEIANLPLGFVADRKKIGGRWKIKRHK